LSDGDALRLPCSQCRCRVCMLPPHCCHDFSDILVVVITLDDQRFFGGVEWWHKPPRRRILPCSTPTALPPASISRQHGHQRRKIASPECGRRGIPVPTNPCLKYASEADKEEGFHKPSHRGDESRLSGCMPIHHPLPLPLPRPGPLIEAMQGGAGLDVSLPAACTVRDR
jgi:hypothetical protein